MPALSPEALAIILAVALGIYGVQQAVAGAKWIGHEAKRGGTAIVHVLKKIPHGHRQS